MMSDPMKGLVNTDNYMHSPQWCCEKTFENGRVFIILIAVGYFVPALPQFWRHRNGLAVIDKNSGLVVFDEHLRDMDGVATVNEFFTLVDMVQYEEFITACKNNPEYRGTL